HRPSVSHTPTQTVAPTHKHTDRLSVSHTHTHTHTPTTRTHRHARGSTTQIRAPTHNTHTNAREEWRGGRKKDTKKKRARRTEERTDRCKPLVMIMSRQPDNNKLTNGIKEKNATTQNECHPKQKRPKHKSVQSVCVCVCVRERKR